LKEFLIVTQEHARNMLLVIELSGAEQQAFEILFKERSGSGADVGSKWHLVIHKSESLYKSMTYGDLLMPSRLS
jgi:hypothetical protein